MTLTCVVLQSGAKISEFANVSFVRMKIRELRESFPRVAFCVYGNVYFRYIATESFAVEKLRGFRGSICYHGTFPMKLSACAIGGYTTIVSKRKSFSAN